METVVVLGASPKPERYSYQAMKLLAHYGHRVLPVNPGQDAIDGQPCYRGLSNLPAKVDTVTLYVAPSHQGAYTAELLALRPQRVIFNPGTENPALQDALQAAGIHCEEACTLVLLRTGQY